MTAAIAFRQPLLPAAATPRPPPAPSSQPSNESLSSEVSRPMQAANVKATRGRKERPCDACRRKKSKCVINDGQTNICVACSTHGQQCTFLEDPRPRKRRLDSEGKDSNLSKRRSVQRKTIHACYKNCTLTSTSKGPLWICNLQAIPTERSR